MSPDNSKPRYVLIRRTHYPIPNRSNIDKEKAKIARKAIIKMYKDIGINFQPDKITHINLK